MNKSLIMKRSVIARSALWLSMGILWMMQFSCYKDNKEDMYPNVNCKTTGISWASDIQPIINRSCATAGCHDASTAASGYDFSTYSGVKVIADNGRLVAVTSSGSMPKGAPKLDKCYLDQIKLWVDDGAAEN